MEKRAHTKPVGLLTVDPGKHWEALARSDPYFSVLTAEQFRAVSQDRQSREDFFRSGDEYVQRILDGLGDPERRILSALDFGCGVGRITLALARRSERVTGVDVSPTMLALTKENAEAESLENVGVIPVSTLASGHDTYDLVNSFLVLQHIPSSEGMALMRMLVRRVKRGGAIALHVPYWRSGAWLNRAARWLRTRVPGVHALVNLAERKPAASPYMQLNVYDLNAMIGLLHEEGFEELRLLREREKDVRGVIILGTRQ